MLCSKVQLKGRLTSFGFGWKDYRKAALPFVALPPVLKNTAVKPDHGDFAL